MVVGKSYWPYPTNWNNTVSGNEWSWSIIILKCQWEQI